MYSEFTLEIGVVDLDLDLFSIVLKRKKIILIIKQFKENLSIQNLHVIYMHSFSFFNVLKRRSEQSAVFTLNRFLNSFI